MMCKMICQLLKELFATSVPTQTAIYLDALQNKKVQMKIKYELIVFVSCILLAKFLKSLLTE